MGGRSGKQEIKGVGVEGRGSCIYLNGKIWRGKENGMPTLLIYLFKKLNYTSSQKKKKKKLLCALARHLILLPSNI